MIVKANTFGILGIDSYPIEVEIDCAQGLPSMTIVGQVDASVKESKERVKSAIKNCGYNWPGGRITVSLSPSDIRKEGCCFDLVIALGILAASRQLDAEKLKDCFILGELSLDGRIRPIPGILSASIALSKLKNKNLILPRANAEEASLVSEINIFPVETLRETIYFLQDPESIRPFKFDPQDLFKKNCDYPVDLSEVKGQYFAKRALEVAVAGFHNILFIGPPGSGKTMLAKRIPTIMPELTTQEALEITKIHSVKGALKTHQGIIATRPFRNPHHTISTAALSGGGSIPQPGEISLAHNGVLFLDELPEFRRDCLEALRQPLEEGIIQISRVNKSLAMPSKFMLACAMNPCPCGYYTDPMHICRCNPGKISSYLNKISGPLLERIDIHIEIPAVQYKDLTDTKESEPSKSIRERIQKAREIQKLRYRNEDVSSNAQLNTKLIKKYCVLDNGAGELLKNAMSQRGLSARSYDKILKVSKTIADLDESDKIKTGHIAEAIQYRSTFKNALF